LKTGHFLKEGGYIMSQVLEIKFNREKEERKALVRAIGEILGVEPVYQRAPSLAYAVGNYTIDRYGTLVFDERVNAEDVQRLLVELSARGFVGEDADFLASLAHESSEVATAESFSVGDSNVPDRLVIAVPIEGFTSTALDNLQRLVSGKAALIMKAFGVDALPIEREEDMLCFPWFALTATGTESDAYSRFVHALCDLAKKQKRVTLKEKPADEGGSDKFAFRCFLLRLGFIGKEYAPARKVLLSKLSGSGSFKTGGHENRKTTAESSFTHVVGGMLTRVSADEGTEPAPEQTTAPSRCQDCHHHCYYSGEEIRTSTGDLVDTSRRTPDKYTHYCLGVPSGFRKLKHATDWSGGETPPKWCPLGVTAAFSTEVAV
jgi:hypothetical protein